jgi:hypothetical protein
LKEFIPPFFLGFLLHNWFFSYVFVRPVFWVSCVISLFLASLAFSLTLSEAHVTNNIVLLANADLVFENIIGKIKNQGSETKK